MKLLRFDLDRYPAGDHYGPEDDELLIAWGRHWLYGDPKPSRSVCYGMLIGPWRIDWYDLWTERYGRPEIHRRPAA